MSPVQEIPGRTGANPARYHKDDCALYKDRESWDIFSLEKRRFKVDLINVYKNMMGVSKENRARCISVVSGEKTGGNEPKLKHRKFCLRKHKTKQTPLFYSEDGTAF